MIIAKYLNREVFKTLLVVLMVLLMLFIGQRFVLYLSGAARGEFSSDLVMNLVLLQVPVFVSYLLPLSLFLGLLITLGKLHAEHEMTVITACGISDKKILSFFTPMILIITLLTGYLTLFQAPAAIQTQKQLIKDQENKGELNLIAPGRFQQTADGKRIIYVEEINNSKELKNIFFVQQDENSEYEFSLIAAQQGHYWSDENQQHYLVLENGNQYQGSPGSNKFNTMEFERYYMQLKTDAKKIVSVKLKAKPTLDLLSEFTNENQGEFQWRISAPISVTLLVLLAIPFSKVPPRQGKFARLLPGLLLYIVYMILLITMRNGVIDGKISPYLGVWWVHLTFMFYTYSEFTSWKWLGNVKQKLNINKAVKLDV